jgi:hypothetical protein
MGYPVPEPPRRQRTLKAVGIAVLSVIRARYVVITLYLDWYNFQSVMRAVGRDSTSEWRDLNGPALPESADGRRGTRSWNVEMGRDER